MTKKNRIGFVATAIAVAVFATGGFAFKEWILPRIPFTVEIEGTITRITPQERTATVEFTNPKDGKLIELQEKVPEECEIYLNGKPATLDELETGDSVWISAKFVKQTKTITPKVVKVNRPAEDS
jgi:hypothetical protein